MTGTSNSVAIQAVRFELLLSPTTIFAGEPTVSVTLNVKDDQGNLLTNYARSVTFTSSGTISGLPRGGLGGNPYTFTSNDAGSHTWTGVTFNTAGQQTITVSDGIRSKTSDPVTVEIVSLAISTNLSTVFAGEPVLSVTVEAQDTNGDPVAGYRGTVTFTSSGTISGLPRGGLGGNPYTFTSNDAGSHTWTGVTLNTAGNQTITVSDGTRTATTDPITVKTVSLVLTVEPQDVFVGSSAITVTVEAQDELGQLVPGYRGTVTFTSTSAFEHLPRGGLGGNPYTFTAGDAGRHIWTGVKLYDPGSHTISVSDGTRQDTSTTFTVKDVVLSMAVNVTDFYASSPITVTVEVRDEFGALVPSYQGTVTFTSTSTFTGLPRGGLGGGTYQFDSEDAGVHTWSSVMLGTAGSRTIAVSDGYRQATSAALTVREVHFDVAWDRSDVYMDDRVMSLTIIARNDANQVVPEYRGAIDINTSVPSAGLPQSEFQATPDHVFDETNQGSVTFDTVALREVGSQTVTVVDRLNPTRSTTSAPVLVGMPPDPTPIPATTSPISYTIPLYLDPPALPTYALGWGIPYLAENTNTGLNYWRGYPEEAIPAVEGAIYVVTGVSKRAPGSFGWSTFYPCPWFAWEDQLTDQRQEGGGYQGPTHDTSAAHWGFTACGAWSDSFNFGAAVDSGPYITDYDEDLGMSIGAPEGTQGTHMSIQGAGNTIGDFSFSATPAGTDICMTPGAGSFEAPPVADPIDTRSGLFYLSETDLGVATGCSEISLHFSRHFSMAHPHAKSLGAGWTHNFESRITIIGKRALVQGPNGGFVVFVDRGPSHDVYAGPAGANQILVKRPGGGWALVHLNRRVDIYDADGYLIAQQDPNGNLLRMTYESYSWMAINGSIWSGRRLARVDAEGDRYIWFGYDYYNPHRLKMVGDTGGRLVRFGHDEIGRLSSVTDTMGGVSHYTYQEQGWHMLSKTDQLGKTVFTNTYDSRGRVIHQVNNLGQDIELSYALVPDTEGLTTGSKGAPYLLITTATDQIGAQATYTYGADGLLRRMVDPAGAVTTFENYTSTRKPQRVIDGLGRVTTFTYNAQGEALTVTNALGHTYQVEYNGWKQPTKLTDPQGGIYSLTYSGPNLTQIQDPLGHTQHFTYTTQAGWKGMLSAISDAEGQTTTLTYTTAGDIAAIINALGQPTNFQYDALGRPIHIQEANGALTSISYDAADRVVAITDALSGTVSLSYDALGRPTQITDQSNATTVITYALELGMHPARIQDAKGGVVQLEYGPLGRLITVTDQLGNQQIQTYDQAGRVRSVRDPLGNESSFAYDLLGNTTVITDANGHASTISYDALSRPIEQRNATGQFLQYGYDTLGNVKTITDTLGATAVITYDMLSRPLLVTDQEGRTSQYAYSPLGYTTSITDGNGIVTRYLYDQLGQITEVIANAKPGHAAGVDVNVSTAFVYDAVGNLREVIDPRNQITSFDYDLLGQVTSLTDPLQRTMSYSYDPRGLLSRWTKADGSEIDYSYDALGLVTAISAPDQSSHYSYDALGRLTEMHDQSGTTGFAYDAASRPLTVTLSLGGSVSYDYDAVGNRTKLIYPDGRTATYSYNEANQIVQINDWSSGVTSYSYDNAGRLSQSTLPNGVEASYAYDRSGLVTEIHYTNPQTTTVLGSYQYSYDASGRRSHAIEDGKVITYTYDGLYRLLEAEYTTGEAYQYSYDASGNRLTKQEPGESVTASYDAANQLLSLNGVPVQYDANGNLTNDGQTSYQYDSFDRLIQATTVLSQTTFGYNANGDRLWQATDGISTSFTLDLASALTQVLASHQQGTSSFVLPGVGQQHNGVWSYLHSDALGSVRLMSDANGNLLSRMRYSPFGELEEQVGPQGIFGFTGEPSDPTGNLLYLRARYYNPSLGRFLTQDSLIPDPLNGQAWNRYAYVYNDPINLVDPSGFSPSPLDTQFWSNWGDTIGRGAQSIGDWWNAPRCQCSPPNGSFLGLLFNNLASSTIGALPTSYWGPFVAVDISVETEKLSRSFGWSIEGNRVVRHPESQWEPWRKTGSTKASLDPFARSVPKVGDVKVLDSFGGHPTSISRVSGVTYTKVLPALGKALSGSVLSGLISGVVGFVQGLIEQPCISPRQRGINFLEDSLYGFLGTAVGVGIGMAILGVGGAPIVATTAAFAVGTAVGIGVGYLRNQGRGRKLFG